MQALVVVESVFGNTRRIAEAIAAGLAERMDTQLVDVGAAPDGLDGIDLLVVGGPTHALSMSRPGTRQSAAEQAERAGVRYVPADGIREWIAALDRGACPVATFDTKVTRPIPGSAASAAARRLRRQGHPVVARPETFRVRETPGPLVDGEPERARAWGARIGAEAVRLGASRTGG